MTGGVHVAIAGYGLAGEVFHAPLESGPGAARAGQMGRTPHEPAHMLATERAILAGAG